MTRLAVPPPFIVPGQAPAAPIGNAKSRVCKDCELDAHLHSGSSCGCCGFAVEHHGPDRNMDFAACLAGRKRMAGARLRAGVDLNEIDRRALGAD